jgi:hypothetical protein
MTPEGNVLIFDNGTHHPITPHSRIVEVDMRTNKIVWQYNPKVVFSFFSGHIGACERLPNANTLICEGQSGRAFEVTPDCEICWEWISPFVLPLKGGMASMLFRAHRYAADTPELRGRHLDGAGYEELNHKLGLVSRGVAAVPAERVKWKNVILISKSPLPRRGENCYDQWIYGKDSES